MSDFDTLCKQLEQMDPTTFADIFSKKSDDVIKSLVALMADGTDGVTAYLQFILASVAADGVLSKPEFLLLKPMFDKMAEKDVSYEEGVEIFKGLGLDKPEAYKNIIDTMVDIIGLVDEDMKDDIILLCLLVCAIDGEITKEEKDWIKQLAEPLTVEVTPMEAIEEFLNKAGTFILGTTDGDQPRMRVLGLKIKLDDKLFFAVGTFKDVYKQLQANPKCEILASAGMDFLRWDGKAVFVKDDRLLPIVENMMPQLVAMYKEMGWELGFFTIEGG
ncbi:MAG: pyridoxamine 5'-phosphate oxidase family protein, partial [Candidatus Methanomethylophilaceae archaeon]|nr:pyridoxamine 5'-phosphate oxidase family protein [Candidatus Methanomethylophilaceae archaeon]